MNYYKDIEYHNDVRAYQVNAEDRFFDLFQSQVFDRRYLSEDYGFCRLWQNMGGTIHADLTVKLNHIGQFCYYGDPIVHLKYSNSVEITQKPSEEPLPPVEEEPIVQIPVIDEDEEDEIDKAENTETAEQSEAEKLKLKIPKRLKPKRLKLKIPKRLMSKQLKLKPLKILKRLKLKPLKILKRLKLKILKQLKQTIIVPSLMRSIRTSLDI